VLGVLIPVSSRVEAEMEYGLTDSGSKLVFCDLDRFKRIEPSAKKLNLPVVLYGGISLFCTSFYVYLAHV
jgi:hypothetical protein